MNELTRRQKELRERRRRHVLASGHSPGTPENLSEGAVRRFAPAPASGSGQGGFASFISCPLPPAGAGARWTPCHDEAMFLIGTLSAKRRPKEKPKEEIRMGGSGEDPGEKDPGEEDPEKRNPEHGEKKATGKGKKYLTLVTREGSFAFLSSTLPPTPRTSTFYARRKRSSADPRKLWY